MSLTRTFLHILLYVSLTISYAQDQGKSLEMQESLAARKRFISSVEFLAGPSMVFFRGSEFYKENDALKFGFSANLAFAHTLNKRFQLKSIIAYETKGSKMINYSTNPDYSPPAVTKLITNMTLNYATVTFFTEHFFAKNRNLFVGCGPYFGYLHSSKITTKFYMNGSLYMMSGGKPDPDINNKRFDMGLAITTGISLRSKRRPKANLQLIYKRGMIDINQPMISQMRNNTISVLLGITVK